jgi:acid stress-induced BolA-like protein IbaG/YrbA
MDESDIKRLIEAGVPGATAHVDGDGRHFRAVVVAAAFAGLSRIRQHRLVNDTLRESFDTEVLHALSIETWTPERWAERNR